MAYSLDDFCADARSELRRDIGPEGRERIARHLEKLLVDRDFVAAHLGADKRSGAETIYTDPDFAFRVMAHTNRGASNNTPHCHGPSWVIYGMAMNHVEMTEWKREDDGSVDGHADLSVDKIYVVNEGEAQGVPQMVCQQVRQMYKLGMHQGWADKDITEMAKLIEAWSGCEIRSQSST